MPVVTINGTPYTVPSGTPLGKLSAETGKMDMPCGGNGRCGKCKVTAHGKLNPLTEGERRHLSQEEITAGVRLACLAKAEGDCQIFTAGQAAFQIYLQGAGQDFPLQPSFSSYGCAVDIGTTTLAACLYDTKGRLLARAGSRNPQAGWGADVISRMDAALEGAVEGLRSASCRAVDELLVQLAEEAGISSRQIDGIVITGNTIMLHLFTGTNLEPLSHAPFAVKRLFGETVTSDEVGLASVNPDTQVYFPPCISAFVGADLVTALLSSGICEQQDTCLLADIGTNGEMALVQNGRLSVCSTAAGPAFEGAGLSQGMQGKCGAIDRVWLKEGKIKAHVIGETDAVGICGSGIVDAVACLLESGQIDISGYMEEQPAAIAPGVFVTQEDVRMIQLAKSAIHAGLLTLLHLAGINRDAVKKLVIAGGFGSYLDVENAGRIGLIPEELAQKVEVVGNAALTGVAMVLLNREYRTVCKKYAEQAKVAELSGDPFFSEEYMAKMMFGNQEL